MDGQFNDAVNGFDLVICRDGQSTISADIPWGGFRLTGLAVATTTGDALSYGQAAVVTTMSATGGYFTSSSAGYAGTRFGATGAILPAIQWSNDGVQSLSVACGSAGVVLTNGATSWVSASDETLKTAFVPFADALEKVSQIKTGTGRYLTDAEDKSRSFLSAQSVQAVLPEAVVLNAGIEGKPSDWDGKLLLSYTDVIPLLVAALAEANARIKALEASVK